MNSAAQPLFYGINCGCPSWMNYINPQGDLFAPDTLYSIANGYGFWGTGSVREGPFRGTDGTEGMDTLYFFWREGEFSYWFDVPEGIYALNLYLCEKEYHWKDFRTFTICAENDTLISDLDLFENVNREYALQLRYLVECNDGQINVDFIPGIAAATLSAISVRQMSPDTDPPPPVQGLNTIGGYEMNIVYWDYCVAPDLAGYRVYRRLAGGDWQLLTPEIHPQYRYLDYEVETGITYEYMATSEDLWGNESSPSDSSTATAIPMENTTLPRYLMEITEENLYQLNINVLSNDYRPADLTLEGEFFPACSLRYRGSNIRIYPKKSYRLKLLPGMAHNGWDKFNLNSQYEPTMLKEHLSYITYDLLNCISSAARQIHLERNDEYIGVYLEVEPVDNDFLERRGLSPAGNLYQCESDLTVLPSYQAYQLAYPKVNNDPGSGWYDIIEFIEWINLSSAEEFHYELGNRFKLDEYLDIYAVLIITQDVDFPGHNYFLYSNTSDAQWYYIPWDHNETFWDPYSPINLGTHDSPGAWDIWNKLLDKVLNDPLFRYAYCKKLERFLNNSFTLQASQELITSIHEEIYEDATRDVYKSGWERPSEFLSGPDTLNANVATRIPFLLGEIPGFITDPDLTPYFRLNELQSDNQATIADEAGDFDPWVEIHNLSPVELDLENFILHYGGQSWTLPAEAVVDDHGFLLLWLDGEPGEGPLHASFVLSSGSGNLWLEGRQGGVIADSVTFPVLAADQVWARVVDGVGNWVASLPPTPGSTNNPLQNPSPLVINEFLALNDSVNPDPAGDYDDWLEIYNPSADTIPLAGIYLTDDLTRPTRWAFPDTFIAPYSFVLIWCDNEPTEGPLHTTFALDGDGEQVGLYHRDGTNPIDTLTFGDQQVDISYGRYPDGSDNWIFLYPTPGDSNSPPAVQGWSANASIPREFSLEPNFPNPFNPQTIIRFALPRSTHVHLKIYDLLGREVAILQEGMLRAGYHSVFFDGSGLASGIYIYHLEAGDFRASQKMILIK